MFKGVGKLITRAIKPEPTDFVITIPVSFSSPISDREQALIKSEVFLRLMSSPVQVAIPPVYGDTTDRILTVHFMG